MMRCVVMTTGILLMLCAAAQANPSAGPATDPFVDEYGNTITQTGPDGVQILTYINKDQTWAQHLPDGSTRRGKFSWRDDHTVCFAQTDPQPPPNQGAGCNDVHTTHNVGDSWTQTDSAGHVFTMKLIAGRH